MRAHLADAAHRAPCGRAGPQTTTRPAVSRHQFIHHRKGKLDRVVSCSAAQIGTQQAGFTMSFCEHLYCRVFTLPRCNLQKFTAKEATETLLGTIKGAKVRLGSFR